MVRKFKTIALAGALAFVAAPLAAPAFAQDAGTGLPIIGDLPIVGNGGMGGMDLDPMHIFTPAAAPMAAPAAAPMMMKKHHMMMHHHLMMHHKSMMMHHKSMMMSHKKMMMSHKMMMKKKAM